MSKFRALLLLSTLIPLAACGPTDVASPGEGGFAPAPPPAPPPPPPPPPAGGGTPAASCPAGTVDRGVIATAFRNCELSGRISDDYTVQRLPGVIYSLSGAVNVGTDVGGDGTLAGGDPVTLTIQAGVTIFGSQGLDYLVVNRGSRLLAVGTPTLPIIFTSRLNVVGTEGGNTIGDSSQGLWGGVILLGRAPISDCNTQVPGGSAACQSVIEGTTGSLYGGATATDNSGVMQYVQIRYSGFAIAQGNELQGLTLGGVGNNTTIDHIQIHNSSDDGIEIFGGRPNLKHIIVTGADDDNLDTDFGYRGTIQFVISIQKPTGDGDSVIEADTNNNEDALPRQYTRVSNLTAVQNHNGSGANAILLRGGTDYALLNSVVVSTASCLDIDEQQAAAGQPPLPPTTTRAADNALQDLGPPVFRSVRLACPTAYRNDGIVTTATIAAIFGDGTNNNEDAHVSTLTGTGPYINGANETAVTPTDPTPFNNDAFATVNATAPNRLSTVAYIGAVQGAADTWFTGWSCNSGYANFGTTGAAAACTVVPIF